MACRTCVSMGRDLANLLNNFSRVTCPECNTLYSKEPAVSSRFNPFGWLIDRLTNINDGVKRMNATASDQQLQLDTLTAGFTDVVPKLIKLCNDLFAANQGGTTLDPTKVQADLDALTTQFNDIKTTLATDAPPAPAPSV